GLLYRSFTPGGSAIPGTEVSLDQYAFQPAIGIPNFTHWLCQDNNSPAIAARMASILGVTAQDQANMAGCSFIPAIQAGTADRSAPFEVSSIALFKSQIQTIGNLFNGNEATGRIDYNWNSNNRLFLQFNWFKATDQFGPCNSACARGFSNPEVVRQPNGMFSFVHTFSPSVLNEFRAG